MSHRVHEAVGDQQRQIELAQAAVLALGADEILHVGMRDLERAHLRAAAAARRRHREAHLVVDIHERHRPGRVRARTRHVGAARTQSREFVADAAASLERQARLVDFFEDAVHRVFDRAGDRAVDRRRRRLVLERTRIRSDAACRNGTAAQRPQKALVPVLLLVGVGFGLRQRTCDALVGVVDARIDRLALLRLQAVLFVPDIVGGGLQRDIHRATAQSLHAHCTHRYCSPTCGLTVASCRSGLSHFDRKSASTLPARDAAPYGKAPPWRLPTVRPAIAPNFTIRLLLVPTPAQSRHLRAGLRSLRFGNPNLLGILCRKVHKMLCFAGGEGNYAFKNPLSKDFF